MSSPFAIEPLQNEAYNLSVDELTAFNTVRAAIISTCNFSDTSSDRAVLKYVDQWLVDNFYKPESASIIKTMARMAVKNTFEALAKDYVANHVSCAFCEGDSTIANTTYDGECDQYFCSNECWTEMHQTVGH